MIDTGQAIALFLLFGTLGGMYAAAWIDTRVIQPWRNRRG